MPEVSLKSIEAARKRIQPYIRETPFVPFPYLSQKSGKDIFMKCEMFQIAGSFKARGATHFMLENLEAAKKNGVIAASAGNHAQGVASICARLKIPATIVMPATTPPIKIQNTQRLGASIELVGEVYDEAFDHAKKLADEKGYLFVPAFFDKNIIAGQGTIALEMAESPFFDEIEAIVISVGGGGLLTGIATAAKALRPELKIYAVSAKNSPSSWKSYKSGKVIESPVTFTLAEGVANKKPNAKMLKHILNLADDFFPISEESIANAIALTAEQGKLVVEGAGVLPIAAVLEGLIPEKKVALILSGGNIDLPALTSSLHRGLVEQGRLVNLEIKISDRPGGLNQLTSVLAKAGANILQVYHQRATLRTLVGETQVDVLLETRGETHTETIISALENSKFKVHRLR